MRQDNAVLVQENTTVTECEKLLCEAFSNTVKEFHFTVYEMELLKQSIGGIFEKKQKVLLQEIAKRDARFGPAIVEYDVSISAEYVHECQVDMFAEKTRKSKTTHGFNGALTSANFAKVTHRLEPGKTYRVRIFPLLEVVALKNCLAFMKKQGALFVGAHGMTVAQEQHPEMFPYGKYTISLDYRTALFIDRDNDCKMPMVYRFPNGHFQFELGYADRVFSTNYCLLCFFDEYSLVA